MKPIFWVLIVLAALFVPLGMVIVITRLFIDPPVTWWATIITGGIELLLGIAGGTIFLVIKLKKKSPAETQVDPANAEERAKRLCLYDNDNPDNLIVEERRILRVGQSGLERTPVLWLKGKGSETLARIDMLVNLNRPNKEILRLNNQNDESIRETIRTFAENPAEVETEERVSGLDDYGRPTTRIRTKRLTLAQKKENEEKEKAEETNAL